MDIRDIHLDMRRDNQGILKDIRAARARAAFRTPTSRT
jgi:hypothetical protein